MHQIEYYMFDFAVIAQQDQRVGTSWLPGFGVSERLLEKDSRSSFQTRVFSYETSPGP